MAIESPLYLQTGSYSARQDRFLVDYLFTEGVTDAPGGELLVTQRAAGANMSVDVAPGSAVIDGDDADLQGAYLVRVTSTENVAIPAPPASGARVDVIVLRVYDSTTTGVGDETTDGAKIEVVSGVPSDTPITPDVPSTALALAAIWVQAGDASITDARITDRRAQVNHANIGVAPEGEVFTASGVYEVPGGVNLVDVLVVSAGQGGQGGSYGSGGNIAAGGFGGVAVLARGVKVTPGDRIPVTVGAGGAGGPGSTASSSPTNGSPGGASSFGSLVVSDHDQGTNYVSMGAPDGSGSNSTNKLGSGATAYFHLAIQTGNISPVKNPADALYLYSDGGVTIPALPLTTLTPAAGQKGGDGSSMIGGAGGPAGYFGRGGGSGSYNQNGYQGYSGAGGGGSGSSSGTIPGGKGGDAGPNTAAGGGGGACGYPGGNGGRGGDGFVVVVVRGVAQ